MSRHDEDGDLGGTTPADTLDEMHLAAARARRRLLEAPGLIGWIRSQVTPAMGGAQDGMPRAASKTPPLPLHGDAVDDSDDAFARILYWVRYWAGLYEEQAPSLIVMHWQVQGETKGFRAGVTAEGATALTRTATTWLLIHQDRILLHQDARTYLDDVADIVWQLHQRYPTRPRPPRGVLDRPCPACDRFTFGAEWVGEGVEDFELSCSFCGHRESAASFIKAGRVRELLHELREEHADPKSEWWTKRKAVLELQMTARTLDRWIVDGLGTYTVEGIVYVNVEDLLGVYRAKRASKKKSLAGSTRSDTERTMGS